LAWAWDSNLIFEVDGESSQSPAIAICAVSFGQCAETVERLLPLPRLSASDQRYIDRFALPGQRLARCVGRWLLRVCLTFLGNNAIALERGVYGQPVPVGGEFSASFSYCPGIAVAAAGRCCRIGVDVEPEAELSLSDIRRALSPLELDRVARKEDIPESPALCWVGKEAVLKADGRGFASAGALQDDLFAPDPILEGAPWRVSRYILNFPDRICAVALACDRGEILWTDAHVSSLIEEGSRAGLVFPEVSPWTKAAYLGSVDIHLSHIKAGEYKSHGQGGY